MEFASAKVAVAVALAMTFATAALAQTETTLYSFPARGNPDGGVSLSATEPGALYGAAGLTTHGEIFELRQKHSTWKYDTLYKFDGGTGDVPRGPFYQDPEGSLYSTTIFGGSADSGTVFEWNPGGETVLYSFGGGPNDGANPLPGMLHDEATGSFYGMTEYGGPASCGIVFQLTPSAGVWTETVLYAFKGGSDACLPSGSLKMEGNGNLLGVTWSGGSTNGGTVFELSKTGQSWTEKVLYTFPTEFRGAFPVDIDMDTRNGDIYGVAEGLGEVTRRGNGLPGQAAQWRVAHKDHLHLHRCTRRTDPLEHQARGLHDLWHHAVRWHPGVRHDIQARAAKIFEGVAGDHRAQFRRSAWRRRRACFRAHRGSHDRSPVWRHS